VVAAGSSKELVVMPKGDRAIMKADPEDGTTPIANLLLEALAVAKLSGREKGFVLYLWRETYGWSKDGKRLKEKAISLDKWATIFEMRREHVSTTLARLADKRVFNRRFAGPGKGYTYSMNTRVSEWCNSCHLGEQLLDDVTEQLPKPATEQLPKSETVPLPKPVTVPDTTSGTPKESIKETLNKELKKGVDLPDFIDRDVWAGFVEMRRKIKAPMTDYAMKLTIDELVKLQGAGEDPNEVLRQSIKRGWRGVFPVKKDGNDGRTGTNRGNHKARELPARDGYHTPEEHRRAGGY
jgi:phage replication O-like protein O